MNRDQANIHSSIVNPNLMNSSAFTPSFMHSCHLFVKGPVSRIISFSSHQQTNNLVNITFPGSTMTQMSSETWKLLHLCIWSYTDKSLREGWGHLRHGSEQINAAERHRSSWWSGRLRLLKRLHHVHAQFHSLVLTLKQNLEGKTLQRSRNDTCGAPGLQLSTASVTDYWVSKCLFFCSHIHTYEVILK